MTRKRNLRKANISKSVAQQLNPDIAALQQNLSAEETGNFGVLYPDGRPNIRQVRNLEREMVAHLQNPHVMLPNPAQGAEFDRTQPLDRVAKNQALGFQVQPDRLIDLPPGDAGAGQSVFRRTHMFARLDNPATGVVAGNPMDRAIGLATYVSSDCRPRFWHISFFGIAVQRVADPVVEPLTDNEILSQQLKPVDNSGVDTADFVPAITQLQGRIMVFDESGQRFYDVDILGNRSIDVYAWGVTAFILAPENAGAVPNQTAYEVNRGSGGNLPQQPFGGLVEDAIIGIRIVPIVINSTQNVENRTITVTTTAGAPSRVPIPPGSRKVQVINHDGVTAAAGYTIQFDAGDDGTFGGTSTMGIININAGEAKSDVVLIPDSVQIIFDPAVGALPTAWSLIFTVEAQ